MSDETPPSELVANKYRLTRLLGRGGMGSVWEGVHVTLGNRVACKFIEPEFVDSNDALSRFENEARAAASLRSKHVVDVYDHGVSEDGRPYIVMEFLEGEPLDSRLERQGALSLPETASIILQVSRALSRAHAAGIVHRDLKPENVFLVWDDEDQTDVAKVVDFGIAKFTSTDASGISSSTKTGSILGTPYYMSPEQARGLKNLDARSDNWSLGVIAYEAITGVRPFDGEAVGDLLVRICTTDPERPSQVNPALPASVDEWMARALHREPDGRFQDVREMAEALVTVSGLPGRGTIGSAVNAGPPVSSAAARGVPAETLSQGSAKTTSGAVTHAAVETNVVPGVGGKGKLNPLVLGGAAAFLLIAAIVLFLSSGGGEEKVAEDEATTEESDLAAETEDSRAAEPALETKPAGRPESRPKEDLPESEPPKTEPKPKPKPAPVSPPPAPVVRPQPRPVVRPRPRPAAPAPSPQPSSDQVDLGY